MNDVISLTCPNCGGALEQESIGRFKCPYCGNDHFISLDNPVEQKPGEDTPTWEDKRIADEVRYQRLIQTKYVPLEKAAKELWNLSLIGLGALVFFFPAAIAVWGWVIINSFFELRKERFPGDEKPRRKLQNALILSLVFSLLLIGFILLMIVMNIAGNALAYFS